MSKQEMSSTEVHRREKIGGYSAMYAVVCGLYALMSFERGHIDVTVLTTAAAVLGAINTWIQLDKLLNSDKDQSSSSNDQTQTESEKKESPSKASLRRALKGDDENAYRGIGGADPDKMNNIQRGREN
jgi:hypothetical protein